AELAGDHHAVVVRSRVDVDQVGDARSQRTKTCPEPLALVAADDDRADVETFDGTLHGTHRNPGCSPLSRSARFDSLSSPPRFLIRRASMSQRLKRSRS